MESNTKCFECGNPAEHNHHVVPKSKLGTKTIPLCVSCHEKVHDVKSMSKPYLVKLALMKKTNAECAFIFWELIGLGKTIEDIDLSFREEFPNIGKDYISNQIKRMCCLKPADLLECLNDVFCFEEDDFNYYMYEWIDYVEANKKD
jgi:hypothetical protein